MRQCNLFLPSPGITCYCSTGVTHDWCIFIQAVVQHFNNNPFAKRHMKFLLTPLMKLEGGYVSAYFRVIFQDGARRLSSLSYFRDTESLDSLDFRDQINLIY